MNANLVEVFSSIQGEGPYLGVRQVFLRFAGCNLNCVYCDTKHDTTSRYRVETVPGTGHFGWFPNPARIKRLAQIINNYGKCVHSISFTGGEPLLNPEFIAGLCTYLRSGDYKFYLETNGTLPEELAAVLPFIDIISMDIKLPSTSGYGEMWQVHREFLQTAAQKETFVKIITASNTPDDEIIRACEVIRDVDSGIPLIIQPITPTNGNVGDNPSVLQLLKQQQLAMQYIRDVRVIPQTHRFLGQL